jgi:hypothetical protein
MAISASSVYLLVKVRQLRDRLIVSEDRPSRDATNDVGGRRDDCHRLLCGRV